MLRPVLAFLIALPFWAAGVYLPAVPVQGTSTSAAIQVIDQAGTPINQITDGDTVRLSATLPARTGSETAIRFFLNDLPGLVASCTIPSGSDTCQTGMFSTLGWYWKEGGQAANSRLLQIMAGETTIPGSFSLSVHPRPVVMVHGFSSSWEAWQNYLGPAGYLASAGIPGFAVGDGQVPGVMNTGSLSSPGGKTNTIAENAAILGRYIEQVKKITGAQQVDLVAHSMGGLIARYYIDRLMPGRDVAQLMMLGSPMAGTTCANLPAALGLYLPAALEIQPGYVTGIFNPSITHRHGVPFYALAGTPILESFKSPCTSVPTDLAVSFDSVSALPLPVTKIPVLHVELNTSPEVFKQFVLPHLQTLSGQFPAEPDPAVNAAVPEMSQFSRLYTGHVSPQGSQTITIPIDANLSVASFALYDSTRSLTIAVQGASGNSITLDPVKNGLVIVKDPSALFYLGYGFNNPKPGIWKVTLMPTGQTPSGGADFALMARFQGGILLKAEISPLLPRLGDAVQVQASLYLNDRPLDGQQVQTVIHSPNGETQTLDLKSSSTIFETILRPRQPGIYQIEIQASGRTPDGLTVERSTFLQIEAQPGSTANRRLILAGLVCIALLLAVTLGVVILFVSKQRAHQAG
jgi:pimeloyl-ACP methyl ester carboxylesterase